MGAESFSMFKVAQIQDRLGSQMGMLMGNALVSVVILAWNRKDDLRFTLEQIRKSDYAPLEVIAVDNNSTDGTGDMIRAEFPETVYLPQTVNAGIAGYNVGFKAARGKYIVVLDSDSYPAVDAITRMVALFGKHPDAGIVAFDVHSTPQDAQVALGSAEQVTDIVGYHGAGAGFRREVFEKAGYWYEPFFLYFNEMDHALRAANAGYRIIHSPAIRAVHKSSAVARPSERGSYYYARNALWVIWRHYPFTDMLAATAHFLWLAVAESFFQRTPIFMKAVRDAFSGACPALRGRRPVSREVFGRIRIPLHLVFTRWA